LHLIPHCPTTTDTDNRLGQQTPAQACMQPFVYSASRHSQLEGLHIAPAMMVTCTGSGATNTPASNNPNLSVDHHGSNGQSVDPGCGSNGQLVDPGCGPLGGLVSDDGLLDSLYELACEESLLRVAPEGGAACIVDDEGNEDRRCVCAHAHGRKEVL